jgi:hypothetical protein
MKLQGMGDGNRKGSVNPSSKMAAQNGSGEAVLLCALLTVPVALEIGWRQGAPTKWDYEL